MTDHLPGLKPSVRAGQLLLVIDFIAISLGAVSIAAAGQFRFEPVNDKSLALWEGDKPVLVYNHGVISTENVPADRARSTYVHPLYGLNGEVLTDDFPKDHYHHRGLFWAWPHIKAGGREYDLWMLKGVEQRFERWLAKEGGAMGVLKVENGWYASGRKLVQEQVSLRVFPAEQDSRSIDVEVLLTPVEQPISLAGAEGKSYGGLTLRFASRTNTVITTPLGNGEDDLPMTHLPWADLSARFGGAPEPSGAAIFVAPSHPDFPPMWLTRHYGVLCLGWPGVEPKTFQRGRPIRLQYRVWVHRGAANAHRLEQAYSEYQRASKE